MRKKRMWISPFYREGCKKMLLWMPQLLVLLLICNLNATAFSQYQKISISIKNAGIEELISAIQKQCNVGFIYDYNKAKEIPAITIDVKDELIMNVLEQALRGSSFKAEIENNTIIIRKELEQKQFVIQGVAVKGKVMTTKGELLPGVTVLIKGTTIGGVTNEKGEFNLTIPEAKGKILSFSFVGMKSKEVEIKNPQDLLRVVLEEAVEDLKEVVVTGIFTRKKESFTGASATYTNKELKTVGNQNVIQSLKTLDPSLLVLDSKEWGSDPNRLPEMEIRGKTSIVGFKEEYGTDPNQPLFILDGFETTLETIMNLSLDRVASVTILKDAASTAIYGSKAANGVVVVETLQPEAGKLRVNYKGDFTVSFADLSDYNLMDSKEKLEFEKLAGYYTEEYPKSQMYKDQLYNLHLAEVARGVDTYWINEPLRTTFSHRHNLYVEGGDEAMRYGLGINYGTTKGVMKGSDKDIVAANFDLTYRVNALRFSNKASFEYSDANREPVSFSSFAKANPYYRKWDTENQITSVLDTISDKVIYNPLYATTLKHIDNTKTLGLTDNFQIEWDVTEALRVRGRIGLSYSNKDGETFKSPKHPDFAETTELERGSYSKSNAHSFAYDGDLTVTYGKLFAEKHQVNFVGGWKFQQSKMNSGGYKTIGFVNDFYVNPSFSSGYKEGTKPDYSKVISRSTSFYLSANYSYDNKYLLDATYRADGSSVFGVNNLFTNTWSVGLAWNIHNELFMKDISWITLLKLRGSIGNPGNQNFSAYQALKTYSYNSWLQNKFGPSAIIDQFGNPNLEWQKTLEKSVGIDVVFWDNRLRLNFDYYKKDTDPLLAIIGMPTSTGTTSLTTNIGKQVISGFDGTFSFSPIYRPQDRINWVLRFTFRHEKGEFKKVGKSLEKLNQDNVEAKSLTRYYDGGSPDDLWAVRSLGIDPTTGNELFLKKDGTSSFEWNADDEVIVGNSKPKLEGIVGTSFYYKGFTLAANFRYRVGGATFASALFNKVENISDVNLFDNQDQRALYDRWKQPGDRAQFKSISNSESTQMSSRFVLKENTFSGESISLGYETTADWLKYVGASSLSFNAYMNEIFRISSIKEERGIEYPFARSVAFSLSLRF
ncbi:MAG: SusC/RagA family TonB-linked outer membrane protein [Odoribacter sp.]